MYRVIRYINDEAVTYFEYKSRGEAERAVKELSKEAEQNEYYIIRQK